MSTIKIIDYSIIKNKTFSEKKIKITLQLYLRLTLSELTIIIIIFVS